MLTLAERLVSGSTEGAVSRAPSIPSAAAEVFNGKFGLSSQGHPQTPDKVVARKIYHDIPFGGIYGDGIKLFLSPELFDRFKNGLGFNFHAAGLNKHLERLVTCLERTEYYAGAFRKKDPYVGVKVSVELCFGEPGENVKVRRVYVRYLDQIHIKRCDCLNFAFPVYGNPDAVAAII